MAFLERDIKYGISKKRSKELRKIREQQKSSGKKEGAQTNSERPVSIQSANQNKTKANINKKTSTAQVNIQTGKYRTDRSKRYRQKKGDKTLVTGKKDTKLYDQIKAGKSGDRVKNTVKGTVKQVGGQYLNAAVTPFAEGKISSAKVKAQNDLGGAGSRKEPIKGNTKKYDTTYYKNRKQVEQEKKQQVALKNQTQQMQKNFEQGVRQTQDTASALRQSGAKDIEAAKEGLGTFGKFGVDLVSQMMMWGSDAALGAMTGTGLLAPMFVRSFGDASMTARESGATHGQQMFAGLASGSVEVATEKLFSPYRIFKKTAGAGIADNFAEKAAYKLADKIAVKLSKNGMPSNAMYKAIRNVVKAGSGMVEEGTEEVLADLAQPLYERSYDKDALKQYGTKEYWANVGRDFGMGAAMAGVLGGGQAMISGVKKGANNVESNKPYTSKEKSQAIQAAKAQGEDTQAYKYAVELETQQSQGKEILDAQVDDLAQKTFQEEYKAQQEMIQQQENAERAQMEVTQKVAGDTESYQTDRMTKSEIKAVNEVVARRVGTNTQRIAENMINVFHADPELAQKQAESIARIKTGTATAADLNVGAVTNTAARLTLQRELRTPLPATNAETIKTLARIAGTARAVQKQPIMNEARQSVRAEAFQQLTLGMDDTTADIFAEGMEHIREMADMPKYMEAFATAYEGGRVNYDYDKLPIQKQHQNYITEDVKMAAYNAGNQVYQAEQAQVKTAQESVVKTDSRDGRFVISDQNLKTIGKNVAEDLKKVTEVTGKRVEVVNQIDAGPHKDAANGKYQAGTIYISAKSKTPIFDVLRHELTHNLQETAPEAYNELKQFVFRHLYESDLKKYDQMVKDMVEKYAESGVELTREQAEDELLADATDVFFTDYDMIQTLVNENRSLGQKLLDGIRSILDTFHRLATNADSQRTGTRKGEWLEALAIVEEAEKLWVKALNESIGAESQSSNSIQYALKGKDSDGVEVYETSKDIKSLSMKEKREKAIELVSHEFSGRTAKFKKENTVYYAAFQKAEMRKNVYGDSKSSGKGFLAKINTMAENGYIELVENAMYDRSSKEQGKKTRAHKDISNWDYFIKEVAIDGTYYNVLINVKHGKNNDYVYDVTLVENEHKKDEVPSLARLANAPALKSKSTSSIDNIISNDNEKSNNSKEEFSLKDQEIKPFDMSKKQILDNMKSVTEMDSVCNLDGSGFENSGDGRLSNIIIDSFKDVPFTVENEVLGKIQVTKRGIKSGTQHKPLYGTKIEGFKAIKNVLESGKVISATRDYNEKGYDRIMLAAPIKIGVEKYYMGVVINRSINDKLQNYYLHDVILAKRNSPAINDSVVTSDLRVDRTVSPYIILQQLNNINNLSEKDIISDEGKFQLKDDNEQLRRQLSAEREFSRKLKAEFKRSKYATPDPKQTGKAVTKLIEAYLGKRDAVLHQSIMQDIEQVYREMRRTEGNWNLVDDLCRNVADKIVSKMEILHDEMWTQYSDLRGTLRKTTLRLSESEWNNIADFEDLRKAHFGTVRLSKKSGMPIDTFYQELAETYPELFDVAEYTNEVDQLYHILDVVDGMKPYTEDYSSGEIAEFADGIAKEVLQMSYDLAQKKTFADIKFEEKQAAIEKVKAERNTMMRKQHERMQKRIDKKDEFYKQKIEDIRQKYKDRNDRKYYTKRIEAYTQWMSDALLRPTDTKHLPDGYAKAIATMLDGFDFSTERTDAYTEKHGPSQKTLKFAELRNAYQKLADQETTEIEIDQSVKELLDQLSADLDGRRFSDLDINELSGVYKLIKQIRFSLSTINKTFSNGLSEAISSYGEKIVAETANYHKKNHAGTKAAVSEFLNISNTTPMDAFMLMGDTMTGLYQNMRSGFDKHVDNASVAMEYIQALSKKHNVKKWIDDNAKPQKFVAGGRTIELVPSQIMSLYCLMQREQAVNHIIAGSGMTASPLPVIDKKRQKLTKAWSQRALDASHVIPTMEEVEEMINTLTPEQKKVADALQKFMNETCAQWGNETSMKLYGYKKFGEKNYFPIKSSDAFLAESFDSKTNPSKVKNVGFTKNIVVNARNPIVLDDIFNVFTQHVNTMSMYNALVPAITDFERVFNYKVYEDGKQVTSVHGSLQQAFGNGAVGYITQFMKDVNQNYVKNRDLTLANKLVANYKKAKIGANLRVLLQQPTAVTRAMAVMNPKHLIEVLPSTKSIPGQSKKAKEEMQAHCPIARWKSWGFYNTDIARDMRDIFLDKKNIVDKMFMDMYGAADDFTWSIIWRAAKKEIKATKPDLEEGSDGYWKAVNERFSYIVDRTQVVDSVFHRSQIMRKQDLFSKTLTSFMAEPTKTWNLLRTEYTLASRDFKSGNKVAAAKRVSRVTATHLITAAFTGAAAALIDALRGAGDDDDDKDFLDNWLSYSGQGFVDNASPINLLPGLRDVVSLLQGYDISRMDMAGMADLINSLQYWQSDATTPYFALKKTVGGIASVTGLPIGSLWRDVESVSKEMAKLFVPEAKIEFVMKQLRYNINDSRNRSKFAKSYAKARDKGNTETAKEIKDKMVKEGTDPEKFDQSVKTQMKNMAAAKAARLYINGKEDEAKALVRQYCDRNDWEYEKIWPKVMGEVEKRKSVFQKAYDTTLRKLIEG